MEADTYLFDGWAFHAARRELISPNGEPVHLTSGEIDLLKVLCENPQKTMSTEYLGSLMQPKVSERSMVVVVSRLRGKLAHGRPLDFSPIKTVRLRGYHFSPKVTGADERCQLS